jgi:hypothetical protein
MAKLVMLFFVSISQYPATLLGAAATVVLPFDTLLTRSSSRSGETLDKRMETGPWPAIAEPTVCIDWPSRGPEFVLRSRSSAVDNWLVARAVGGSAVLTAVVTVGQENSYRSVSELTLR